MDLQAGVLEYLPGIHQSRGRGQRRRRCLPQLLAVGLVGHVTDEHFDGFAEKDQDEKRTDEDPTEMEEDRMKEEEDRMKEDDDMMADLLDSSTLSLLPL